jgi:mono/diheme cytochrome c family protein
LAAQKTIASAALLALAAACGGGGSDYTTSIEQQPTPEALRWPSPSYAQVQAIFTASCTGCHAGASSSGGLSLAPPGSWSNLVGVAAQASSGTRVVRNDSASSVIFKRITGSGLGLMPPTGGTLSAASIETVRSWIDEGGARQDLSVAFTGMSPHVGEKVVLRLQGGSGELRAKIVLDPLPTATFAVLAPRAIPAGSHVLDVWADHDRDGAYDAPPTDHAWRLPVPASGIVAFVHDTAFTDVGAAAASEPGLDFTLSLTGMTPHVGQTLTVAVFNKKTAPNDAALVGLYRVDAIPSAAFSIAIPGIIQANEDYWVDLHADLNGNGSYDAPPTDHAWRVSQSSDATGLAVSFAHAATFTDVSRYPAF